MCLPFRSNLGRSHGFTLVELLVTLGLLAVLATIVVPSVQVITQRQKERLLMQHLSEIRSALDTYKRASDQGRIRLPPRSTGYPASLDELVSGAIDLTDPKGKRIYFLRRIPVDPFCPDPSPSNSPCWGLRSYASPPDNPLAGDDVYDVFSRSNLTGLNGIPYKQW